MDNTTEQLYLKWKLSGDTADELNYLNHLAISGVEIEITRYSFDAIQKFFIGLDSLAKNGRWECNPAENIFLNGKSLADLLRVALEDVRLYTKPDKFFAKYNREEFDEDLDFINVMKHRYEVAVSLHPFNPERISSIQVIVAAQSEINYDRIVNLIDIEKGQPYFARLEEVKSAGLLNPQGYIAQFFFEPSLGRLTDNFISGVRNDNDSFWITDRQYPRELSKDYGVTESALLNHFLGNDLVLLNQIKINKFLEGPQLEINYGCEDYPSCGHDNCPPNIDGYRFCNICTCGYLLPMGIRSICEACLKGDPDDYDSDDLDELEDV